MKHLKTSFIGFLLGSLIGVLVSFGEIRMIKKSYRTTPVLILIFTATTIFFGISSASFFTKAERDIDNEASEHKKIIDNYRNSNNLSNYSSDYTTVEDLLGKNKSTTSVEYENNRLEIITKWVDNRTSLENSLVTFENDKYETVSKVNSVIFINYGKFENHKSTLAKLHARSQYDYFEKLKHEHINSQK